MMNKIEKNCHVTGQIIFSEEEKKTIQKAYAITTRVKGLINELDNHMENFEGYLIYSERESEEAFYFEEIFDALEHLKNLKSIDYEYIEPENDF